MVGWGDRPASAGMEVGEGTPTTSLQAKSEISGILRIGPHYWGFNFSNYPKSCC